MSEIKLLYFTPNKVQSLILLVALLLPPQEGRGQTAGAFNKVQSLIFPERKPARNRPLRGLEAPFYIVLCILEENTIFDKNKRLYSTH